MDIYNALTFEMRTDYQLHLALYRSYINLLTAELQEEYICHEMFVGDSSGLLIQNLESKIKALQLELHTLKFSSDDELRIYVNRLTFLNSDKFQTCGYPDLSTQLHRITRHLYHYTNNFYSTMMEVKTCYHNLSVAYNLKYPVNKSNV